MASNLVDYEEACHRFSWDAAAQELEGLPDGRGLNIAHEAVDPHARGAHGEHVADRHPKYRPTLAPRHRPGSRRLRVALPGDADLREALDIDSMDFLRFVVDLHDTLHVDIPERDYAKIRTVDACVTYLGALTP